MNEQNFWIVGILLKVIGGVFVLLSALFAFLATLHTDKTEKTKAWFQRKWEILRKSTWLHMPEKMIGFIVNAEKRLSKSLGVFMKNEILGGFIIL